VTGGILSLHRLTRGHRMFFRASTALEHISHKWLYVLLVEGCVLSSALVTHSQPVGIWKRAVCSEEARALEGGKSGERPKWHQLELFGEGLRRQEHAPAEVGAPEGAVVGGGDKDKSLAHKVEDWTCIAPVAILQVGQAFELAAKPGAFLGRVHVSGHWMQSGEPVVSRSGTSIEPRVKAAGVKHRHNVQRACVVGEEFVSHSGRSGGLEKNIIRRHGGSASVV